MRAAARILPADVRVLRVRNGPFKPALIGLAAEAAAEEQRLLAEIGGEHASEQRRLLVRDVVMLGLLARALVMQFAQTEDADLATRAGSLLGQRRSALQALGLERTARDVPDLHSYLAERASGGGNGAGHETDAAPVSAPDLEDEPPAEGAAPAETVHDASDSDERA